MRSQTRHGLYVVRFAKEDFPYMEIFPWITGQAIREASLTVLRQTVQGSERAGRKNIFYADSPQAAGD